MPREYSLLVAVLAFLSAQPARADHGWPTYMRDYERTGVTSAELKLPLHLRWTYLAPLPPQPAWPPPAKQNFWKKQFDLKPRVVFDRAFHVVASEGHIYFGSSADDSVTCLDAKTGRSLWRFYTEGPVRLAPSVYGQKVYFGSDDGYVYCVHAEDGRLLWKYRGGPNDRRIPGNGRIVSTWPVRSDVMIQHNVARFTAGLFPKQGVYQVAVDAATGKLVARSDLSFSPQGYLEKRGDRVYFASGRAGLAFFSQLKRRGIAPAHGRDKEDKTASRPSTVIGTPRLRFVGGQNQIDARAAKDGQLLWSTKVDGQVYSLAIADGQLLASTDTGRIYCFAASATKEPIAIVEQRDAAFEFRNEAQAQFYRRAAAQIVERTKLGNQQGYCLVLGSQDGGLAYEIARQSKLRVIGIDDDTKRADATRRRLAMAGFYGARVAIHHADFEQLPYGDRLFNLVVSDAAFASGSVPSSVGEAMRVLRPSGGVLSIGTRSLEHLATARQWFGEHADESRDSTSDGHWIEYRAKPLAAAGKWTHLYGDVANTLSSGDRHVGSELAIQWFGRPGPRLMVDRHLRAMSPLALADMLIVPGNDHVFAVDTYNGAPRWDRAMKDMRRVSIGRDTGQMALSQDTLYIAAGSQCHFVDVATGKTRQTVSPPALAESKPHDWGYVAVAGDRLIGSTTLPKASRRTMSHAAILEGYTDYHAIVTSRSVFCLDRRTGKPCWPKKSVRTTGAMLNPTFTIGDGRLYFVASADAKTLDIPSGRAPLKQLFEGGAMLFAVDLSNGSIAWQREIDLRNVQHDVYLGFADGRLVLNGSGNLPGPPDKNGKPTQKLNYYFWSFHAESGEEVWRRTQLMPLKTNGDHGEQNRRPVLMNGTVYLSPWAFRLSSGKPLADWRESAKRRGCGAVTASASTFFFRNQSCAMLDVESQRTGHVTSVTRPGCWVNMIPASGLLLVPEASSGCVCKHAVQASMAFGPKSQD